jgi:hypothetical protein
MTRYRRGVPPSVLLAFRPAGRPIGWAVLAALGAGILAQNIVQAMAVVGHILSANLFVMLVAASAPAAALVAGFVARASGGWRAAAALLFLGLIVGAAIAAVLAASPFCIPSAICTPANPIAVFATVAGADGVALLGALLSIVVPRGARGRWAILEGAGAHEFVASTWRLLSLVPHVVIGGALSPEIAAGIGIMASGVTLVRRSERPIRDAGLLAVALVGTEVLPPVLTLDRLQFPSLVAEAASAAASAFVDAAAIPLVTGLIVLAVRRRRSRIEGSATREKRS